jgi:CheY-like chemotaxis protein/anti-sigma regulatory factor (Ser/Thr protein kinase)
LECDVPPDVRVAAPPAAVREVLTNLILNALEAMPEGGAVAISAVAGDEQVELTVRDTGVGMSRETLASLGELFATGEKRGGHGIGLATSREIVAAHGGSIMIESEPDVGTTCRVTLPLASRAAPPADSPGPGPAALVTGRRVMVVDNEPRVASLVEEILAVDQHTVVVAYSGEEAMSKFQPGEFDLLLCDVAMPGMSGLEVSRAIRALDPQVAVVLITGWGQDRTSLGAGRDVVDFVVAKPLDVEKIRSLVADASRLTRSRRQGGTASASAAQ